ncbi:MAG: peptidylprolyl isomerase [Candidatus Aminicenantes bacterium]|nr:peptidylprolyl isomerase [Candidatus Aminicenantes bacterium]
MKHSFKFTFAVILSMGVLLTAACCTPPAKNIFHDKTLQLIYTLQNQRNTPALLLFLKNENPVYRKAAAKAFASVQDPAAVQPLAELFADAEESIRSAAAYALGQTANNSAEPILIKTCQTEKSAAVKQDILEALGKCGTTEGLAFLTGLNIPPEETNLLTGQAWGLYRFAVRNIISPPGTARAVELINPTKPEKVRFIAANYLSRTRGIDLQEFAAQLLQAFEKEQNLFTRMNLVSAMGKAVKPEILDCLKALLTQVGHVDYRVKVNALRALQGFAYQSTRELLLNGVKDENTNVSVAASEFLLASGKGEDAQVYLDTALNLTHVRHVRTRAALLAAALKYAARDNKELRDKISGVIMAAYKKAPDNYAKAYYLGALAGDYVHYAFVQTETFANKGNIIGSTGITALVEMGRDAIEKKDEKMAAVFAGIFKEAIGTGDTALIGTAAGILREPEMNFKTYFKDVSFFTTALDKCLLPQDIDAYLELRQTMDFFNGTKTAAEKPPLQNKPIDWQLVTSIDPDRRVKIKTVKGDIVIRVLVNESPGSASNFVQLIKDGFYKESYIHRVAPNFVIQDGCPRGDGWGSPPYSIGSELGPRYYEEGSVGMASSGKDTESSQWFITHSPTPHLDGRYTIFGQVVSGMEVVHKLEVGDKILGFELK